MIVRDRLWRFRVAQPVCDGFMLLDLDALDGDEPAEVANRLPRIPTRLAWGCGFSHVTDDESVWPVLWDANRAVAEAYNLSPDDLAHILTSFPGVQKKRSAFFAYLLARVGQWARGG